MKCQKHLVINVYSKHFEGKIFTNGKIDLWNSWKLFPRKTLYTVCKCEYVSYNTDMRDLPVCCYKYVTAGTFEGLNDKNHLPALLMYLMATIYLGIIQMLGI